MAAAKLPTSAFVSARNVSKSFNAASWGLKLLPNFINCTEERILATYFHGRLKHKPLHTGHFDNAIANYREENRPLDELPDDVLAIARRAAAHLPPDRQLQQAWHVIDLAPSGEIFPHVDNNDHLGEHIIGISCLSDAVMRFTPSPHPEHGCTAAADAVIDVWLPRRSLYVMAGECRLQWQHAVLCGTHSMSTDVTPEQWQAMMAEAGAKLGTAPITPPSSRDCSRGEAAVTRGRRMSIILRERANRA